MSITSPLRSRRVMVSGAVEREKRGQSGDAGGGLEGRVRCEHFSSFTVELGLRPNFAQGAAVEVESGISSPTLSHDFVFRVALYE